MTDRPRSATESSRARWTGPFGRWRRVVLVCGLCVWVGLLGGASSGPVGAAGDGMLEVPVRVETMGWVPGPSSDPSTSDSDSPVPVFTVSARSFDGAGEGADSPEEVRLEAGTWGHLTLAPGRWELTASAESGESWWGETVAREILPSAPAADGPRPVTLRAWPAGFLEARITGARGEEVPAEWALLVRPAPSDAAGDADDAVPPGRGRCRAVEAPPDAEPDRGGTPIHCAVPAGRLDLRLEASGRIPRHLWGVPVPIGATVDLGALELVRGAAVQGWVVTRSGELPEETVVRLEPATGTALRGRDRLANRARTVPVNSRGFFEILGVSPGRWRLEAEAPGYASALGTVTVEEGMASLVADPPLMLEAPRVVEVVVDPATDFAGEPWRLELLRRREGVTAIELVSVATGRAGPDGRIELVGTAADPVRAGPHTLRVMDHQGQFWHTEDLEIEDPRPLVWIDLEAVAVEGTVRLGDDPLPARLVFGGFHGVPRLETESDGEGRYRVVLPRAGTWPLGVEAAGRDRDDETRAPIRLEVEPLSLTPSDDGEAVRRDIELPDTLVRVRVTDRSGHPVEGARVDVRGSRSRAPTVQGRTDADGRTRFRAVPSGGAIVHASAGPDRQSRPVEITVPPRGEATPVELVLEPSVRVPGFVTSAAGSVAGAEVRAVPVGRPRTLTPILASDATGAFTLHLPPGTREVGLSVAAPGFAYRLVRFPIPSEGFEDGRRVAIRLSQEAGTLVVDDGERDDGKQRPDASLEMLVHGGTYAALTNLERWARLHGVGWSDEGRLEIPFVEPGVWTLCRLDEAGRLALARGVLPGGQSDARCTGGALVAGGRLELVSPGE